MYTYTNTQFIDLFLTHQQGRSLSPDTVRRRRSSLNNLARFVAPLSILELDAETIDEWIGSLVAARTRRAYQGDVAAFYRWAARRKLVDANPTDDMDGIRIPKSLPRPVPAEAVRLIIATAADRDLRVGLALATFAGLRRSEVVALQTGDINLVSRPPILTVRNGKWNRDRLVPVHPELARMLDRRQTHGRVVPMTADTFGRRAAEHIRSCGYDYSVHALRSTFATELARISRGNVLLVGKMLGHETPQTTMGYIGLAGFAGAEIVGDMFGDDAA